jgi:hypothetical protein
MKLLPQAIEKLDYRLDWWINFDTTNNSGFIHRFKYLNLGDSVDAFFVICTMVTDDIVVLNTTVNI